MNTPTLAASLHGILLTGGRSSRMGADKALLTIEGVAIARRVAAAMQLVAEPVIVVGPHRGLGVEAVADEGLGPLVGMVTGWDRLVAGGWLGPIFLAACDLPFLTAGLITYIAECLRDADAAIPVLQGRAQPLSACFAAAALPVARDLISGGHYAMRDLVNVLQANMVPEAKWGLAAAPRALFDVDTPEALEMARQWSAHK